MSEPQLFVRSARDTAQTDRELAADFYTRISKACATDIDLDALIRADRSPHNGETAVPTTIPAPKS